MANTNEKRLIDANALTDDTYILNSWDAPIVRAWLDDQPTVDAVEVVHGKWVYDHWCEFKCSICGEYSNSKPYKGKENYCPNCGAKMDGDSND